MYSYAVIILVSELILPCLADQGSPLRPICRGRFDLGRQLFATSPAADQRCHPDSGAGRALVTNDQYQAYGVIYANALDCNATDVSCFHRNPKWTTSRP